MTRMQIAAGVLIVLSPAAAPVFAQRAKGEPDPIKTARWDKDTQAAWATAQEADIKRLAEGKVLITNETYKQIFSAYMGGSWPLFITSDSVLNGYHVLYEESVLRLEKANAAKLPRVLRFLWKRLPEAGSRIRGREALVKSSRRRAQLVIGVAMRLAGDDTFKCDADMRRLIDAEAKRIETAEGMHKPEWLGEADDDFVALDYSRYRPRGFYTHSDRLQRYFRAVSWLQSVPFRVRQPEELLAILILGSCLDFDNARKDPTGYGLAREYLTCYTGFIGRADDWNLLTASEEVHDNLRISLRGRGLDNIRDHLLKKASHSGSAQINDQVRFAPADPSKTAAPAFRVLSAYRTPDAVLFTRTTDLRRFKRPFPSGLEVPALLGSVFAREKVAGADREKLLETIASSRTLLDTPSLYTQYLHALAALVDAAEPDAPKFMSGPAWQAKSCQTVLAGWAQLRHTWALQAKQSAHYLGLTRQPPGFVEPDPEFFARLGRLVRSSEALLRKAGAFETDYADLAADMRKGAKLLATFDFKKPNAGKTFSAEDKRVLNRVGMLLMPLMMEVDTEDRAKAQKAAAARMVKLADEIEKGKMPEIPMFREILDHTEVDVGKLWRELADVCHRLESLAHKQLRGVPFTEEENAFIRGYGTDLAGIMLYGGNAYLTPRDDAPRVIDVFSNPNTGEVLEVGVARARAIYVLYPHDGAEVLCKGAVMPYYEFRRGKRLTDAEWRRLLDSADRPATPAWLKPIIAVGDLTKPDLKDDD